MEKLKVLIHWFYCLDIPDILFFLLIATTAFVLLNEHYRDTIRWRWLIGLLLICWLSAACYATLGTRNSTQIVQINLVPFHSYREVWSGGNPEIYRSNFMNVVLFYPAGLLATSLLPEARHGWRGCLLVVLALTAMSAGIEFIQDCCSLGKCEIDDVIHNALGALTGAVAAEIWVAVKRKKI